MTTAPEKAKGGQLSWSISRHETFTTCRRKYYHNYYASFEVGEIDRLKKLSNLDLWVGNLVHDTIEVFLKTHTKEITAEGQVELIRRVTHGQMPQDWGFSVAKAKKFRLFEHEYGVEVSAEDKAVRVGLVQRCLRSFFASEILREAVAVGRNNWLSIDELKDYMVDGVKVYAAMDFAYRLPGGRVRIVDWKTGRSVGRMNKVQLAGYALLALQQGWAAKPEDVDTTLAYLAVPDYKTRTMTAEIIADARDLIRESAATMASFAAAPGDNTAAMADFPMTENKWACRRCPFQRVCYPEGMVVSVAA